MSLLEISRTDIQNRTIIRGRPVGWAGQIWVGLIGSGEVGGRGAGRAEEGVKGV